MQEIANVVGAIDPSGFVGVKARFVEHAPGLPQAYAEDHRAQHEQEPPRSIAGGEPSSDARRWSRYRHHRLNGF
jgi:hypothetical protein